MTEKELITTTPISPFNQFDQGTTFMGAYEIDRMRSLASSMLSSFRHILDKTSTAIGDLQVLAKKEAFTLSQNDFEYFQKSLNKLEKASSRFGDVVNDWKFANDMRALQLSTDDLAISLLYVTDNTRYMGQTYNFKKFTFIIKETGSQMMEVICKCGRKNYGDIIKHLDEKGRAFLAKSGRRKGEHVVPWGLSRKWYKKILKGFTIRLPCEQCGHVNEVRDHKCIEYIEPDRSTRGNP